MGFPGSTSGKDPACQRRRHRRPQFNPWVGKTPGGGHGNPLQCSCLENPVDRGAWRATVHGVIKSWARLKRLRMHTHLCTHMCIIYEVIQKANWAPSKCEVSKPCQTKLGKCPVIHTFLWDLHSVHGKPCLPWVESSWRLSETAGLDWGHFCPVVFAPGLPLAGRDVSELQDSLGLSLPLSFCRCQPWMRLTFSALSPFCLSVSGSLHF